MPLNVVKLGLAALATGTAALSLMYIRRKSNRIEAAYERAFREQIFAAAAEWCAPQLGRSVAELRADLATAIGSDWRAIRTVPGIARIDLRLKKDSATKVTRTVGIRLLADNWRIGALSREYEWDQLPSCFRSAFIRQGESTLCWSLYDATAIPPSPPSATHESPAADIPR